MKDAMTGTMAPSNNNFDNRDNPSAEFIADMQRRFPTERETDELLVRKLQRRISPSYQRPSLEELSGHLQKMLENKIQGAFEVSDQTWFTGGVSKIQMGFTLRWNDPQRGPSVDRLVIRMDPSESSNTTSRVREFELLSIFENVIPVPRVFGWIRTVAGSLSQH